MNSDFKNTVKCLDGLLKPDINFDLVKRNLIIAERQAAMYFVDGYIKDEVFEKILEFFYKITPDEISKIPDMETFSFIKIPYVEVDYTSDVDKACTQILSGPTALVIEGIDGILLIDTRTYPTRSINEPDKDKSLRGSRDGFVETLIFNTAMIRRRIRDVNLRMEYMQVGKVSKVDVAICYLDGVADKKTVEILKNKLKKIDLRGISMTHQAIGEGLVHTNFFNPFPKFKYTERPDYTSASIIDGRIVLIMDNSPSVMILPVSFADFFREIDDYYFSPAVATYNRIMRWVVSLLTVLATPLFTLAVNHADMVPQWLQFILPDEKVVPSVFIQFLVLEFVIDGLKLASVNTPSSLSSALGIIGGLLLSELAISAGWFNTQTILFMAFVAITTYSQPSFEMGYAMKFARMFILILTQIFALYGFIGGIVLNILIMLWSSTLNGRGYLYPIFPFNKRKLLGLFLRKNIYKSEK